MKSLSLKIVFKFLGRSEWRECFGVFSFSVSLLKLLYDLTSFLNQVPYARKQYPELDCKTAEVLAHARVKVLACSFITCSLPSKLPRSVCVLHVVFIVPCQHR